MPVKMTNLTPEFVARFLEYAAYDPETGRMWWIKSKKKVVVGSEVGSTPIGRRYRASNFEYQKFMVHRMAWVIVNGPIPEGMQVDHINGNRHDNRMCNLRLVTHTENCENKRGALSNNKSSGLLGVSWSKSANKWHAYIKVNKKRTNLGYFQDKHEAHQAYLEAKRRLHPGCTI